jgi:hypothetical protein
MFWGSGIGRKLDPALYIPLIPVPMLIAAFCLWVVRIPRRIDDNAGDSAQEA